MGIGIGGAIVVVLAVIFALTFLPALLAVLGPRIHGGSLSSENCEQGGAAFTVHLPSAEERNFKELAFNP